MIEKAYVLGNGPDRPTDIEWLNDLEGDTYGFNAMSRDWHPDFLVRYSIQHTVSSLKLLGEKTCPSTSTGFIKSSRSGVISLISLPRIA